LATHFMARERFLGPPAGGDQSRRAGPPLPARTDLPVGGGVFRGGIRPENGHTQFEVLRYLPEQADREDGNQSKVSHVCAFLGGSAIKRFAACAVAPLALKRSA